MAERSGVDKVIAEAAAEAGAPARPAQLSLLGECTAADMGEVEERRGPGRRPGSQNLATRQIREFIASQWRHPLVTLARIQAQDPVDLARALGCKPVEALDRIKSAADMLAPYLAGKMPAEDANGNAVLPVIQLVDPAAAVAGFRDLGGAGPVLDLSALEIEGTTMEGDMGREDGSDGQ